MRNQRRRRGGFTLPEVLVTVAIVAVLAAMVVPAVTQQIGKGDAPGFLGSINGLRTAIASFASDVRRLPGELSQLSTKPIAATDRDLGTGTSCQTAQNGTLFTTPVADRWRGPYENSASNGLIRMGSGWITEDCVLDSLNHIVVTINLTGGTLADQQALDALIDGANGASAGLVRWNVAPSALTPEEVKLFLMSSAR